jgi:hypothetical protein
MGSSEKKSQRRRGKYKNGQSVRVDRSQAHLQPRKDSCGLLVSRIATSAPKAARKSMRRAPVPHRVEVGTWHLGEPRCGERKGAEASAGQWHFDLGDVGDQWRVLLTDSIRISRQEEPGTEWRLTHTIAITTDEPENHLVCNQAAGMPLTPNEAPAPLSQCVLRGWDYVGRSLDKQEHADFGQCSVPCACHWPQCNKELCDTELSCHYLPIVFWCAVQVDQTCPPTNSNPAEDRISPKNPASRHSSQEITASVDCCRRQQQPAWLSGRACH